MSRVAATLFTDFDKLESGPPGGFMFAGDSTGKPTSIVHKCPCGCGQIASLRIRDASGERPSWEWDGNREKPTLSPSVFARDSCGWHGYLRAGIWESC